MKKTLSLLIITALVISFSACGNSGKSATPETPIKQEENQGTTEKENTINITTDSKKEEQTNNPEEEKVVSKEAEVPETQKKEEIPEEQPTKEPIVISEKEETQVTSTEDEPDKAETEAESIEPETEAEPYEDPTKEQTTQEQDKNQEEARPNIVPFEIGDNEINEYLLSINPISSFKHENDFSVSQSLTYEFNSDAYQNLINYLNSVSGKFVFKEVYEYSSTSQDQFYVTVMHSTKSENAILDTLRYSVGCIISGKQITINYYTKLYSKNEFYETYHVRSIDIGDKDLNSYILSLYPNIPNISVVNNFSIQGDIWHASFELNEELFNTIKNYFDSNSGKFIQIEDKFYDKVSAADCVDVEIDNIGTKLCYSVRMISNRQSTVRTYYISK